MDASGARDGAAGTLAEMEEALLERQALLAGPDTPESWRRIAALSLRVAELLEHLAGVGPADGAARRPQRLDDESAAPSELDRFRDRRDAERRAG